MLLHGGQVVSQFGTKKFVTKGLLHFFMVLLFFILLLTGSTGFDLSHLGGWADRRRCPPRPREERPRWPRPKVVCFSWT